MNRFFWIPKLDLNLVNVLLIMLIIVGGIAGYNKFPEFSPFQSLYHSLTYRYLWIGFLIVFNVTFIMSKCLPSYLRVYHCIFPSFTSVCVLTAAALCFSIFYNGLYYSKEQFIKAFFVAQGGITSVLFLVQGWFKPRIDVRSLELARKRLIHVISNVRDSCAHDANSIDDLILLKEKVNVKLTKFVSLCDSIIANTETDDTFLADVKRVRATAAKITDMLRAPASGIADEISHFGLDALEWSNREKGRM